MRIATKDLHQPINNVPESSTVKTGLPNVAVQKKEVAKENDKAKPGIVGRFKKLFRF